MDFKNISEELQIVRMIVARWGNKYDISSLEHSLVMDKLREAENVLDAMQNKTESAVSPTYDTVFQAANRDNCTHDCEPAEGMSSECGSSDFACNIKEEFSQYAGSRQETEQAAEQKTVAGFDFETEKVLLDKYDTEGEGPHFDGDYAVKKELYSGEPDYAQADIAVSESVAEVPESEHVENIEPVAVPESAIESSESESVPISEPAAAAESEDDIIPTLSRIEREIIMHETGSVMPDTFDAEITDIIKKQKKSALKSLYYDDDSHDSNISGGHASSIGNSAPRSASQDTDEEIFDEEIISLASAGNQVSDSDRRPLPGSTELKKVLGEILNTDSKTIADTYPESRTVADRYKSTESRITSGIIGHDSIRKSIGLNDRYLLIRDLFNGDAHLYEKVITELDSFDNLEDTMLYVHDNFNWDATGEGSKLLVELLVNKFR